MFLPLKLIKRFGIFLIIGLVIYYGITTVQVVVSGNSSQLISDVIAQSQNKADVIIVVGAPAPGGTPSADLVARLLTAYSLYKGQNSGHFIVMGESQEITQAETTYLEGQGVLQAYIQTAIGSNTWQQMVAAGNICKTNSFKSAFVVTDPYNEMLAASMASDQNLTVYRIPTQNAPGGGFSTLLDYLGDGLQVAVGRIIGYSVIG
jgi:uncharacterized SAM-binding protein YcdF (DUF218 family)